MMTRRVGIIGTGMARSGASDVPSWILFARAAKEAATEAGIKLTDVQGLHYGNAYSVTTEQQNNISPLVLSVLGIENHIPCVRYEAACASGSIAFRQGYLNIMSGMYDIMLVGGGERMRGAPSAVAQGAMSESMADVERKNGLTFSSFFAMVAKAYARKYGLTIDRMQELLGEISVKSHYHGSFNKLAHFQKAVTLTDVLLSPMVCDPIKVMDSCPFSDGGAALILASEEIAKNYKNVIWIAGSGHASGFPIIAEGEDLTAVPAAEAAVATALKQAKITIKDVDIAEVHDCSSMREVMCLESSGMFKKGEGIFAAAEKKTYFDGEMPVNCSGGLKSRGHPVGATGAYQLAEITRQLRGDWGGIMPRNNPQIGITVNIGGGGAVVTSHVLTK
jgi:acetyl-CoA C-acetyltransferase